MILLIITKTMKNINLIKMILFLLLVSSCNSNNKINSKSFNNKPNVLYNTAKDNIMFLKTIYYDFNSFELKREAKQNLDLLAKFLLQNSNKNKTVDLYGYCDNIGTDNYNYNLGLNRSLTAKEYLITKGINTNRINAISIGKKDNERKVIIVINK